MSVVSGDNPRAAAREDLSAISVRGLRKQFGAVEALREIDLEVAPGELFGLIGPDGAGKTTLFQILSGVMEPTGGAALVGGERPRAARHNVGYVTQRFSLYSELSVDENLRFSAGARNVPAGQFADRRERYLREMELLRFADRLAGHLSGGMKQKLALCCALISNPRILLLDEPTTGLDPLSRREFWHLLASIAEQGTTTVVATPQFDEAELCDRVGLIHKGGIYKCGAPAELRAELRLSRLEIHTPEPHQAEQVLLQAARHPASSLIDVHAFGDRLDVLTRDARTAELEIKASLNAAALASYMVLAEQPTLQNVFVMNMRGEGLGEVEPPPFPAAIPGACAGDRPAREAILARDLRKNFDSFQAVRGISLEIRYGEIYGLLGANGAGKTTTIQMLAGLIEPSGGEVALAGETDSSPRSELRRRIGYMSQKFTLYDDLSVLENLEFYCSAYGVARPQRAGKIDWVLSVCGLAGMERMLVGQLPRGLRQKVAFGASVLHEPEILFLDEPTAGVDPMSRRLLWKIIREFARNGSAILVSTHFLEDAEYCHRLGLMVLGDLVCQGSPRQIKEKAGTVVELATRQMHTAFDALSASLDCSLISVFPGRLRVQLDGAAMSIEGLLSILDAAQVAVERIQPVPSSLEDAFVAVARGGRGATP